jgi:hypothetical protein
MSFNIVNPELANKSKFARQGDVDREDQISTLRQRLLDPSTPEGCKTHIENAIAKIEYHPRRREVIR